MNISPVNFVTPKTSVPLVEDALYCRLVPMLHGSPSIGKSAIVAQIAKKLNLLLIDVRMAGFDPVDMNGLPMFDPIKGLASFIPMDTFPLDTDTLPTNPETNQPYNGWLLFLDEFNSAPMAVQAAAYKLVLDHKVGCRDLHKKCAIVCAGNLDTDGAITNPMSSAMVSRIVHLVVEPNLQEWLEWALANGINSKLCAFLEYKTDAFYTFDANEPAHIYSSPRTLEFASRLMDRWNGEVPLAKAKLMAGTISEGVTTNLRTFLAFYSQLTTLADILAAPDTAPVPSLPGVLYALDGCIADWIDDSNIVKLLKYVDRMPAEHQIITFRMAIRKNRSIRSNPDFLAWADLHADTFIY